VGGGGGSSAVDSANCATSDCGDTDKKEAELVSVCTSEGCMSSTQRHLTAHGCQHCLPPSPSHHRHHRDQHVAACAFMGL